MPKTSKRNTGDLSARPTRVSAPLTKKEAPLWKDLRILLAAKLYAGERMTSERASKLAGINHIEFLLSLGFYKVFPLQAELTELEKDHG